MLYSLNLSFDRPNIHDRPDFIAQAQIQSLVEAQSPDEAVDKIAQKLQQLHERKDEILNGVHKVYLDSILEIRSGLDEGLFLLASCFESDEDEMYSFATVMASDEHVQAYCYGDEGKEIEPLLSWD